jgi:hypothetical protein
MLHIVEAVRQNYVQGGRTVANVAKPKNQNGDDWSVSRKVFIIKPKFSIEKSSQRTQMHRIFISTNKSLKTKCINFGMLTKNLYCKTLFFFLSYVTLFSHSINTQLKGFESFFATN